MEVLIPATFRLIGASVLMLFALIHAAPVCAQPESESDIENRIQAHLAAAKEAEARQDYLGASKRYERILELRPQWALIRQSLGVTYHLGNRYAEAITQFQEAVRLDDQLWGSYLFLGMDLYQTHQFRPAVEALEKSLSLNPGMAGLEASRWLGLSYAALQQYEQALDYLSAVLEKSEADSDLLFHLARAYDGRAAQLFASIGRLAPQSAFVHLLQAERFAYENDLQRARVEHAKALELRPDLDGAVRSLAQSQPSPSPAEPPGGAFAAVRSDFLAGRYQEVAAETKQVLVRRPEDTEAMYWLGRSYKGLAREALSKLAEADPSSYRVDQLIAEQHDEKTEYEKAIQAYERALSKRSQLSGLRYAIGNVYWKMRRYDDAEKWLTDELKINPHHALTHYRLGELYLDRGAVPDAVRHLEQGAEALPDLPAIRLDLGRAFLAGDRFEDAAGEFEIYVKSDPENDRAHYLLATAYRKLGRTEEAKREFELYQRLSRDRLRRVQKDVRSVADDIKSVPE